MGEFADNIAARTTDDISEFVADNMRPLILRYDWTKEETLEILALIAKVSIETMRATHDQTMDIINDTFANEKGKQK